MNDDYTTDMHALTVALAVNVPTNLLGEPGVGKSATARAIGARLGFSPVVTITTSIHGPESFAGVYYRDPETGRLDARPVGWWAHQLLDATGPALWIVDDATRPEAKSTFNALMRCVNERHLGDVALRPDLRIILTSNPAVCSGTSLLTDALANRLVHLDWPGPRGRAYTRLVMDRWVLPALPVVPETWRETNLYASEMMSVAFAEAQPQRVQAMPKTKDGALDEDAASGAWPSLRSWQQMAVPLDAACLAAYGESARREGLGYEVRAKLLSGSIGSGHALAYLAFQRELDIPNLEAWLDAPEKATFPERADKLFAAFAGLLPLVTSQKRFGAAAQVLGRAVEKGHRDIGALGFKGLQALGDAKGWAIPWADLKTLVPFFKALGLVT